MDLHQLTSNAPWYIYYDAVDFNYSMLHMHGFTVSSPNLSDLVPYDIQLPNTVSILRISYTYGTFISVHGFPWVYSGDNELFYDFIDRVLS